MKKLRLLLVIAILLAAANAVFGADSLQVGDSAPLIKAAQWIKGPPIGELDPGRVYAIEFWATWCPACKESISYMNALASTYQGKVTVASVCVRERVPAKDVVSIVNGMDNKISYSVALDAPDKFMEEKWTGAANRRAVPSLFIVGKGRKIAWIGFPWEADQPLKRIIDGMAAEPAEDHTYDKEEAGLKADMQRLLIAGKFRESIEELIKFDTDNPKYKLKKMPSALWNLACANIRILLAKDELASYGYARKLADGLLSNDSEALAWLANSIIDDLADFAPPKPNRTYLKHPDYELALSAAIRAAELSKEKDASVLNTLSKAYEKKGDVDKATTYAERALSVAQSGKQSQETVDKLKSRLQALKNKP